MPSDIFDQAAVEPDIFDQASSEGDVFDQAEATPEAPQTYGDKASRFMAASGEQALKAGSMLARIYEPNQMVQFFSNVSRELGGPTIDELQMELEGAASRSQDEWGVNPKQQDSFLSKLATGAGSIVPALATGPAAPGITALSMGEEGLQEARDAGGTPGQQFASAALNATTGFLTEKLLGIPKILKAAKAAKVPEATLRALVSTVAKQAGMGFAREGIQETLEEFASDFIAKSLAGYDPKRNLFDWKKLGTTFLVGGLVGAPVAGTLTLAENASPEQIAPKQEMQELATNVDSELQSIVEDTQPVTSSGDTGIPVVPSAEEVPVESLPVTEPTPETEPLPNETTPEAQAPPTETTATVLSKVTPPLKGESVVSTGIQLPSGEVVTGQDFNSPHASLLMEALDKGLPETDYEQNLGFVVQDEQGNQRFTNREEALEIARKTGQVDETKLTQNTKGLQSEGLITPVAPVAPVSEPPVAPVSEPTTTEPPPPEPPVTPSTPEEPSAPEFTALANRRTDAERAKRGLPPSMRLARSTNEKTWDETMRLMEEDKDFQPNLIRRLKDNPRSSITDQEVFALVHAKVTAQNKYYDALERAEKAPDDKTRQEFLGEAREAEAELNDIEDVSVAVGSMQGKAFQARKQLISRDYSIFRLRAELKAEQGSDLTPEQETLVQNVSENVQRLESEVEARRDELEGKESQEEFDKTFKEFQEQKGEFSPKIMEIARKIVATLDREADKARKRIRSRMANASSGVDPTVLYDVAVIGSSKIARGLLNFTEWAASMRQEFGDWIEPYLKVGFEQANARIDRLEETVDKGSRDKVKRVVRKQGSQEELQNWKDSVKSRTEKGESLSDLRGTIQRMALNLVRNGVSTSEDLLDAMQGILEPIKPGLTRREVMDLISGYGDMKALDMESAKVTLRDLKGQMQQLSKLQDIEKGQKPLKTGIERRTPSKEERELIRQVNEAKERTGVGTLDAYKARLQNQITDLELRIKRKDFRKKVKNLVDISKDAEAVRLLAEAERWRKKFRDARYEARKSAETKAQTAGRYAKEVLNIPRAVKSSLDFSAVLRQGGFVGLGNPVRAAKNLPTMFRSAFSQEQFEKSEAQIRARPNAPLYKQSKLYLADMDGDLTNREEAFRSEWSDKIPGVKGSNRAYISYLNRMRADTFDALVGSLGFNPAPEQLKAIAHYVNVATGRGDLGAHGAAAETLSTILWSPRLLVSRVQLLAGEPLARGDAAGIRKVIAKEYAKTLTAAAVILSMAAMWGLEVEKDPRSSDFGKIRIGETRVDPWMGLQQLTVLASRLASGETKTLSGDVNPIRGEDRPPFGDTGFDVSTRFIRSKLTPLLGEFFNIASGENVIGEKTTPASTASGLIMPLILTDVLPMLEDQGIPKTIAIQLLNLFGASVQHHSEKED